MVEVIAVVHGPGSSLLHDCIKTGGVKQSGVERRESSSRVCKVSRIVGSAERLPKSWILFFLRTCRRVGRELYIDPNIHPDSIPSKREVDSID